MQCLNGTRLIVLAKEYWIKYRESRLYDCGGLHLNLFVVKRPLNKGEKAKNGSVMSEYSGMKSELEILYVRQSQTPNCLLRTSVYALLATPYSERKCDGAGDSQESECKENCWGQYQRLITGDH